MNRIHTGVALAAAGALLSASVAFAQATPGPLGVMVTASQSVSAGTTMAPLALITLDGTHSGEAVNIPSIPVTFTFNGAAPSEFANCSLRNVSSLATPLNTGGNAVVLLSSNGGAQTFTLDTPLSVPADGIQVLALTCDVSAITPAGSSVTISVLPASIPATGASSGATVTPTVDTTNTGGIDPTIGTVEITAPGTTGSGTTVPGVPNTGAGGNAPLTLAILAMSGLAFFGAVKFLPRRV